MNLRDFDIIENKLGLQTRNAKRTGFAAVRSCVGSEEATSRSVMAKQDRTLPSASGRR